jgi:two-component system, OmpR family, response regulator
MIECESDSSTALTKRLADFDFLVQTETRSDLILDESQSSGTSAIVVDTGNARNLGSQSVRRLRNAGCALPIAVVSPQCSWRERVEALDAGADDFIEQPFRAEELAARLRALIRRASGNPSDTFAVGDLSIDLKSRSAAVGGVELILTRHEFRLLRLFLLDPARSFSGEEIKSQLYSGQSARSGNAVEVHIARLRRKIGHDRIRTVRGVGYRLTMDESPSDSLE